MSSNTVGSGIASLGALIFFYYSTWIFIIPFIDSSHWLHAYFLDKIWAVRIPQILLVLGLGMISSLLLIATVCSKKQKTS
ncbi:hypothetical protein SteCoe_26300 [Stentor coeruleus]|uniref:Dolichol phosphate-mannose biosynthesis regulatory protein n=1 Tax=Stentor coeruleus TaxID=5963 RepID=A0A1R2BD77_9CILI|nr:hypothetical protein SteCoe_26300 [Stentor coeruleus]